MSKQFWAVIAAIVIIFVGIFAISGSKSDNSNSKGGKTLTNHVKGSTSSGVTFVEYGDFQCPYCEQYYPTVSQVVDEFKDQIQFQFRNYPLTNAHPNAFAAARAAEAAGQQDKFWDMYDALYNSSNYQDWTNAKDPTPQFKAYASQLGLDAAKFSTDFSSSKVNDLINADMAEGNKIGITGTPSFYINGKAVQINNDADSFRKVLKKAIADQAKQKPATTSTDTSTPATTDATGTTEQTTQTPAAQ